MKPLSLREISDFCDNLPYSQGFRLFKDDRVSALWVSGDAIGGQVRDFLQTHTARYDQLENNRRSMTCTCQVGGRKPCCGHVAAILIAWASTPEQFAQYDDNPADDYEHVPRAHTGEDARVVQELALGRVETLLRDLIAYGLLTVDNDQIALICEIKELARTQNLGRIATELTTLVGEARILETSQKRVSYLPPSRFPPRPGVLPARSRPAAPIPSRTFDEARYTSALLNAWHLTRAARRALHDGDLVYLSDLLGLPLPDEASGERRHVELVELATCTLYEETAAREASFLLDLTSGRLFVEQAARPLPPPARPERPSGLPGARPPGSPSRPMLSSRPGGPTPPAAHPKPLTSPGGAKTPPTRPAGLYQPSAPPNPPDDELPDWLCELPIETSPVPPRHTVPSEVDHRRILHGEVTVYRSQHLDQINLDPECVKEDGAPTADTWRRAIAHAERRWGGVFSRLQDAADSLPGVYQTYTWFAPQSALLDDGGFTLFDEEDTGVRCTPAQVIECALDGVPPVAVFGRLEIAAAELRCHVLSLLRGDDDDLELVRLSG